MNTTEYETAIADAQNAVQNRPQDSAAFEALGRVLFEAERYDEAMSAFQRAVALNPQTASAYNGIGHIHYRVGNPQPSIEAYEKGIKTDPHYAGCYYGLGILYATKLGQYDRAIEAFERGLAANPADTFLQASLGSIYARKGQIEKALKILAQVVRLDPMQSFALSWLALLYLHLGRYDDSMKASLREIEIEDNHDSHRLLGYCFHAVGRNDEAIAELERAIELEPEDYEARGALAKVYRESGNLPAAEKQYKSGLEMAERDDEYGQSCFHAVSGNIEQALTLLETGVAKGQVLPGWIRIDPEFAFIQDEPRFQALVAQEENKP